MDITHIALALLGIFAVLVCVALALSRSAVTRVADALSAEKRSHARTMERAINAETELWRYKRTQTGHRMDWPELVEPQPIPPALAEQECETAADYSPRWTVHGGTA